MHPMTGLDLDEEAAHYMPEERLVEWEEYDEKIEVILRIKFIPDLNEALNYFMMIMANWFHI